MSVQYFQLQATIKDSAKIFLSMAMAAVGFITMITVGLVNIIAMQSFTKLFLL